MVNIEMAYPAAVIWDLDGTLVDSAPDLGGALNSLLQRHSGEALDIPSVRRMIGNGVAKLIERGFAENDRIVTEHELHELLDEFMPIYTSRATRGTCVYPGAMDALQAFSSAGVAQALCTNKPEGVSRDILRDLELEQFFEVVIGGDTLEHRKPHALPLQTCLATLGASVDATLMIGDSAVDVDSARAVGMTVGVVTHGYARQPVATLGADFLIPNLANLPSYITQYLGLKWATA